MTRGLDIRQQVTWWYSSKSNHRQLVMSFKPKLGIFNPLYPNLKTKLSMRSFHLWRGGGNKLSTHWPKYAFLGTIWSAILFHKVGEAIIIWSVYLLNLQFINWIFSRKVPIFGFKGQGNLVVVWFEWHLWIKFIIEWQSQQVRWDRAYLNNK